MKGSFITFEGGEGSGKSTQIRLLADELVKSGKVVVTTREPGGTPGAEEIRKLLVTGSTDKWDKTTETLLFFASRRDHLMKKVFPALEMGAVVLCDRFADSTMAYQGYGYGDDSTQQSLIKELYAQTIGDFKPNLTILLDIPVEVGLIRSRRAGNVELRFEDRELAFHERLRRAYLMMAKAEPERFAVIDATQPIPKIHQEILKVIEKRSLFAEKPLVKTCLKKNKIR
ncbi:MAG: dTMP kinase [Alphaproteobacteria bacterium]|nr:dTMP kinase [Alphaproteobacteria bacterium]